jgi:hypothetical protein
MRHAAWALGALTAIFIAAIVSIVVWQGMPVSALFLDTSAITKLVDIVLALCLTAAVILTSVPASDSRSSAMAVFAWTGPLLGLAGALFYAMIIWVAVQRTHITRFVVVAPSLAEAMLPLALGLLVGALAAASGRKTA